MIDKVMIEQIRRKLKILSMVDSIVCPKWQFRYFSYYANWSKTEEVGSLRDGEGGEWFFWSHDTYAAYKCLSPEDGVIENISKILEQLPDHYKSFVNEPAFSIDYATCIWHVENESWVKQGKEVEFLIGLQQVQDWTVDDYQSWAEEYYEKDLRNSSIAKIFENKLSDDAILDLNPNVDLMALRKEWKDNGLHS